MGIISLYESWATSHFQMKDDVYIFNYLCTLSTIQNPPSCLGPGDYETRLFSPFVEYTYERRYPTKKLAEEDINYFYVQ